MTTAIVHDAGHVADAPGETVAAALSEGERDVERTLGEHGAKIDTHETIINDLKTRLESAESRLESVANNAISAPVDVTGQVRDELERVLNEALDAAETLEAAAEAGANNALEDVAPPPASEAPKTEKRGFFYHLSRLI